MNSSNDELAKARAELAPRCDVALLSSVQNVTYVSGFEVPVGVGVVSATTYALPFAVLSVREGGTWLGVSAFHAQAAEEESRLDHLLTFDAFDSFRRTDPRASYLAALRAALEGAGVRDAGRLGVEGRALPHGAAGFITEIFPRTNMVEIDDLLVRARFTKTPRETELLRRASQIGDVGHRALAALVEKPGRNECDMYAEVTGCMQRAVGRELSVVGELVSGRRTTTTNYPGGPRDRITEPGDPVLMDISQRVSGYWSDVTNTHIAGGMGPAANPKRLVRAAQLAFEAAVEVLRPGKLASDVWNAANAVYLAHGLSIPHNVGHQLGVTVNELPRLVPYDHTPIQANMVFAVEPGAYEGPGGTFGARFEKDVLVTESGPEILSHFEWGL